MNNTQNQLKPKERRQDNETLKQHIEGSEWLIRKLKKLKGLVEVELVSRKE